MKNLLLFCFFLISHDVYAATSHSFYTYQSEAESACQSTKASLSDGDQYRDCNTVTAGGFVELYRGSQFTLYLFHFTSTDPVLFCSEIGFDPSLLNPQGFCVDDGSGNPIDSEYSTCYLEDGETQVSIPRCYIYACPDGSYVNVNLGESCPLPKQCPDGSIVYGDQVCPPPIFICPDGSRVSSQLLCPDPTEDLKQCFDGSFVPVSQSCPEDDRVLCSDGSYVVTADLCPIPIPEPPTTCQDGTKAQNSADCPSPNTSPSPTGDTSTSTSTSTSTTTNNETNTTETTTTTTNTTTELNLDGLNSRLDSIITNQEEFAGLPEDFNVPVEPFNQIVNQNLSDSIEELNQTANPYVDLSLLDINDWFLSIPEPSACSGSINSSIFGRSIVISPCEKLAPLRDVFGWVFSLFGIFSVLKTVFSVQET